MTRRIGSASPRCAASAAKVKAGAVLRPQGSSTIGPSLPIKRICSASGIPLIEDAACAIGSSENGVRCGAIADLTCFSFHPRKLISTGEGGAITTHSDEWAQSLAVKLAQIADMLGLALVNKTVPAEGEVQP